MTLLGGGEERTQPIKLTRGMESKDSKHSQINLKRFKSLEKKKQATSGDVFKVIIFGVPLPDI